MSRLIVSNIETQNIKFDSDTTAFSIASDGTTSGVGAGAMVKLLSATGISGSSYEIDSTYINSTYDTYEVVGYFRPNGDNRYLQMRVMVGGTVQTGSIYAYEGLYAAGGSNYFGGNTEPEWGFQYAGSGTTVGRGTTLHARFSNVNSTIASCAFTAKATYGEHSGGAQHGSYSTGQLLTTSYASVVNGFHFKFHTGDISDGFLTLYGLK